MPAAMTAGQLGKFLTTLHDEVLEFRGETTNFTSLLRCACLTYVAQLRPRRDEAPATTALFADETPGRRIESPV